jgi:hypothetical protein
MEPSEALKCDRTTDCGPKEGQVFQKKYKEAAALSFVFPALAPFVFTAHVWNMETSDDVYLNGRFRF